MSTQKNVNTPADLIELSPERELTGKRQEFSIKLKFNLTGTEETISYAAALILQEDLNSVRVLEEQEDFRSIEFGSVREQPPAINDWVEVGHYLSQNQRPEWPDGVYFQFRFSRTGAEDSIGIPALHKLCIDLNELIAALEKEITPPGRDYIKPGSGSERG